MEINVVRTERPDMDQTLLSQTVTIDGFIDEYHEQLEQVMDAIRRSEDPMVTSLLALLGLIISRLIKAAGKETTV